MEKQEQARAYLERDPLGMMDMLGPLNRGILEVVACREDGVLAYNGPGEVYMLAADSLEAAQALCRDVKEMDLVATHSWETVPYLCQRYGLDKWNRCTQAAYLGKEPLPMPEGIQVRQLGEESFQVILDNYQAFTDPDYIHGRIRDGVMHGAVENGQVMGFIGMHAEGSVGLLQVLPAYQRRGVATALMACMTNWFLERGWTPFSQIFEGNTASTELHKKVGWTLCPQDMFWVRKQKG